MKKTEKLKKGMFVRIGTPTGNNFGLEMSYDSHKVLKVKYLPHNDVVPYSITTCCGEYNPTSASDGRWKDSMHLGVWRISDHKEFEGTIVIAKSNKPQL